MNELVRPHWDIIDQLMRVTGATISVPHYPLAPEHLHGEAFAMLEAHYRALVAMMPAKQIILCGDSAGGNLAIGQAIRYRDAGLPLPGHLILFAPWLDLTMTNPECAKVQSHDPMLWNGELAICGKWWAGTEDPASPALSPFALVAGSSPAYGVPSSPTRSRSWPTAWWCFAECSRTSSVASVSPVAATVRTSRSTSPRATTAPW